MTEPIKKLITSDAELISFLKTIGIDPTNFFEYYQELKQIEDRIIGVTIVQSTENIDHLLEVAYEMNPTNALHLVTAIEYFAKYLRDRLNAKDKDNTCTHST